MSPFSVILFLIIGLIKVHSRSIFLTPFNDGSFIRSYGHQDFRDARLLSYAGDHVSYPLHYNPETPLTFIQPSPRYIPVGYTDDLLIKKYDFSNTQSSITKKPESQKNATESYLSSTESVATTFLSNIETSIASSEASSVNPTESSFISSITMGDSLDDNTNSPSSIRMETTTISPSEITATKEQIKPNEVSTVLPDSSFTTEDPYKQLLPTNLTDKRRLEEDENSKPSNCNRKISRPFRPQIAPIQMGGYGIFPHPLKDTKFSSPIMLGGKQLSLPHSCITHLNHNIPIYKMPSIQFYASEVPYSSLNSPYNSYIPNKALTNVATNSFNALYSNVMPNQLQWSNNYDQFYNSYNSLPEYLPNQIGYFLTVPYQWQTNQHIDLRPYRYHSNMDYVILPYNLYQNKNTINPIKQYK